MVTLPGNYKSFYIHSGCLDVKGNSGTQIEGNVGYIYFLRRTIVSEEKAAKVEVNRSGNTFWTLK